MLLGVVSDTHGQIDYTLDAVRMLDSLDPEVVLHCGDVGSPDVVAAFGRRPTHYVFGNVDDERSIRRAIEVAGGTCHERFGSFEIAGVKIALLHGDDERLLAETIASGAHDLVCHGHTHAAKIQRIGRTTVLNPGALYRATPHSLAIVELPAIRAEIIAV